MEQTLNFQVLFSNFNIMKITNKKKIYFAAIAFFLLCNFFVKNAYATVLENGDTLSQDNFEGTQLNVATEEDKPFGVTFNNDGTKMFMVGEGSGTDSVADDVHEYVLSTPYDTSTATFRVGFSTNSENRVLRQIQFNKDGSKMFVSARHTNQNPNVNRIYQYSLSTNFDLSTATYSEISFQANTANVGITKSLYGFAFNNDGTMMFLSDGSTDGESTEKVYQLSLETAFDLSGSITVIRSVDLETLEDDAAHQDFDGGRETEPSGIAFNEDGTRMFLIGQKGNDVNQYTLSVGFNISTASFDGGLEFGGSNNNPNGIAFSPSGLKMFSTNNAGIGKLIRQFNLPCPFNFFAGKCESISKGDRVGIAEAQINLAKRTIEYSTDTALNRLQWIRRNKDLQDLSLQNIKLNFSNEMLASLSEAIQISTTHKKKNKDKVFDKIRNSKDVFYWSEGSLAFGKVRETDTSSEKKIYTEGITIGADKFTDDQGIKGLAFRFSENYIKVGNVGSKLDTNTYNLTYYSTTPVKDNSRFLDTVLGVGFLQSDISNKTDGLALIGNRNGRQIYGTLRLKGEIKKDNVTLIPAGQIDLGYTLLSEYSESGKAGIKFDKQSLQSRNLKLYITGVEDIKNKKYEMKKHGKLEYQANLHSSSNIKYSYVADSSSKFETQLHGEALHNINGEIGVDVIYDENFSLFLIYEHNRALGSKRRRGYTNKIHLAIGYLPQKNTNLTYKIEGDDILRSKYIYTKNINGLDIEFYLLNNDVMRPQKFNETVLNLKKVF